MLVECWLPRTSWGRDWLKVTQGVFLAGGVARAILAQEHAPSLAAVGAKGLADSLLQSLQKVAPLKTKDGSGPWEGGGRGVWQPQASRQCPQGWGHLRSLVKKLPVSLSNRCPW